MGDYYFPALIYLIWIRTKNSPLLRGCMFPLHHKAYQQLIYITMELPTTGQYEVISLWYTRGDSNPYCFDPKSNASYQLGYPCIWWKEVFHLLQHASPRSRATSFLMSLITRGFYYEVHHSCPISLCLSLFLIGLLPQEQ